MNSTRRDFFKRAGGLIASVAIAQGIVRKLFDTRAVNPEWVTAPYEMDFVFEPAAYVGSWTFLTKEYQFPEGMGSTTRSIR